MLPNGARQKLWLSKTEHAYSPLVMPRQHSYHPAGRSLRHLLQVGPVAVVLAWLWLTLLQPAGSFRSVPCVGYGVYPVLHLVGSEEISVDRLCRWF